MNNKMVRFLNSLDIADVEVFDLDFDLVGMNPIDKTQVDMAIVKDTPCNIISSSAFRGD